MKRILTGLALLGTLGLAPFANAQLFPYNGQTTTSSGTATATGSVPTGTFSTLNTSSSSSPSATPATTGQSSTMNFTGMTSSVISSTGSSNQATTPISAPAPIQPAGYIQLSGLIVNNVSGVDIPATISASNPAYLTNAPGLPATCETFAAQLGTVGTPVACPTNSSFNIQIAVDTQLLLKDRTTAVLGNITANDILNVFGYYDGAGNVQASIVRDLSKPEGVASSGIGTTPTIAGIRTQIAQIELLLNQLIQEVNAFVGGATSTGANNSGTSAPMIPAVPINPSSTGSTNTTSGTGVPGVQNY